jgi:hypothetical protein
MNSKIKTETEFAEEWSQSNENSDKEKGWT